MLWTLIVFIPESENWQCFSRLLSRHFPPCFDLVVHNVSQVGYNYDQDIFDFSQGHVTKNQPRAVPV